MKKYIPSKDDVFELLKDSEVGDKEYWKKEIVLLEILQRSRIMSEERKKQSHKREKRLYFVAGFIVAVIVSVILLKIFL
ncbi:MAG: hypothetical protein Q8928_03580 [Bacteroidota bacterium]|nr:hypothetical protein [Bacteroidota bacterium]